MMIEIIIIIISVLAFVVLYVCFKSGYGKTTKRQIHISYKCDTSDIDVALKKLRELNNEVKPIKVIEYKTIDELINIIQNTISGELVIKHHACSQWSVYIEGTEFRVTQANTMRSCLEQLLSDVIEKGLSA